ncbi:uncharacterized protein [Antedon mediterranea]|uniref:uncharacterized protein n=1 Tax=Antedon mediterranea TaxID=105859 RepID=UPI003AF538D9
MLTEISPAVSMCTITQLMLNFNSIETLGTGKIGTNATEEVMLSQNNISSIGKANFKGMTKLKVLMIAHNNISSIDDYAFDDSNLSAIYLYGNQLSNISQFAFKMTEEKQQAYLYIHDNPIYTIDEDSFASFTIVYLSCEQLHKLPNSVGQNVIATCAYDGINITLEGLSNAKHEKQSIIYISGIECPGDDQTECTFCQRGTFGNKDEHAVCLKCPPGGYYQDMLGFVKTGNYTTDCKRCPNGTFSTEAGASSMSNCLACPLGTQTDSCAGLNACDCSSMFHRFERFGECIPCPSEGVDCSGGYQQLQNGYWWSWNFTNSIFYGNHSGSPAAEYDEFINGLNNSTFDVSYPEELKNVKYNGSIPSVHRCPRPKSCISNGTLAACAEGYEDWLCVVCKKGYYTLFYECHKCPHSTILLLMFSVITLLVVLIGALTFKYQTMLRQKYDKLNIKSVSMYVKIAINYYQIIGILSVRRNDLSKTIGGNLFIYLDIVGYINLLSPRCIFYGFAWNAYKQAVLSICVPVVIILFGCVAVIIVTIKRKRNVDFPVTNGLVCFVVLLLLYFTYANTCSGIMAIGPWAYRTFNVTHDGSCTRTMLKMDYSIIISNDTGTNAYLILCYFSFLYVIGFPVSIGCILYYVRRRRRPPPFGRYHSYQQLLSTDCSNIGGENNEEHAFNNDAIVQDILNSIDYEQTEQQNQQHDQKQRCQWPQQHQKQEHHLSFFYVEYTPRCWFWEVLEIFTKAALALIVNYENYSDIDIAYSVLVIVCLILLHIHFRPIKNKFAQRFQITTLVYVVLNLSVKSILSREGIGRTSETVTSGVLTCINASVVVIAVVVFVQTFFGGLIRKKFASVIISCFCDPKQA